MPCHPHSMRKVHFRGIHKSVYHEVHVEPSLHKKSTKPDTSLRDEFRPTAEHNVRWAAVWNEGKYPLQYPGEASSRGVWPYIEDLLDFGPKMGSRRAERVFKMSPEAVGFILAEFEPKRSHRDPIRDIFMDFGHAS